MSDGVTNVALEERAAEVDRRCCCKETSEVCLVGCCRAVTIVLHMYEALCVPTHYSVWPLNKTSEQHGITEQSILLLCRPVPGGSEFRSCVPCLLLNTMQHFSSLLFPLPFSLKAPLLCWGALNAALKEAEELLSCVYLPSVAV